jgi:hypothetical protein
MTLNYNYKLSIALTLWALVIIGIAVSTAFEKPAQKATLPQQMTLVETNGCNG